MHHHKNLIRGSIIEWVLGNSKNQWPCDCICKTSKELQGRTIVVFLEISKTNECVIAGIYLWGSLFERCLSLWRPTLPSLHRAASIRSQQATLNTHACSRTGTCVHTWQGEGKIMSKKTVTAVDNCRCKDTSPLSHSLYIRIKPYLVPIDLILKPMVYWYFNTIMFLFLVLNSHKLFINASYCCY